MSQLCSVALGKPELWSTVSITYLTGVISGAGTANPSRAPDFTSGA